jgi:hypothetical protein|tara:strand:- start:2279 stop:2443 length:165 start_codon:yes stop_codon:yes gene_type:complete
MSKVTISIDMTNRIIKYLVSKPYGEVNLLVQDFLYEINKEKKENIEDDEQLPTD